MINTSNEYRKYIVDSVNSTLSRDFRAKADITLADGTVLNITEEDIVVGGLEINDATSSNNSFQIGSAIINQCTLMLNNIGGKFDQYDFTDAVIRPSIGLKLSETTEWLKKGIFTVDEPTVASSIIALVALDNMNKFDTPFSDVAISFPCTQLQLLQAVCLHCGVSLTNAIFTNSDFVVTRRPDDEAITCREIVAWIAQNSGNFARCNTDGALELKWYDTEAFEQADSLDGGAFDGQTTDKLHGLPEGTMESAGRNLLKKTTDTFQTVNHSQYFADVSGVLNLKDYGLSVGEVLTASVYVKTTSIAEARIRFRWLTGDDSNHANDFGIILEKNSEGMLVLTSKIPAQTESFQLVIHAEDNDTNTGTFEYKLLKLEKGSIPTPWTPAPEDLTNKYQSGDHADGGDFTYTEQTHYDGGTFKQAEKYHHIYALNQATIGTDDVIITGIQVKAQGTQSDYGETVLFGNKGYVIEITNPLITENTASIIANSVGAKIVGMRFRPCTVSALSDPSREAGDIAYLSHKGSTYQILLTNISYQIGASNNISCDAETPSRKQSVRFDASTKAIVEARNIAKQEISSYDLEQQRFNNLVFHSFGLYRTEEVLEDGSTIEYAHDKPTLAESQNVWRQSANTFAVSNDGGANWRGIDADGNILANVLNAIGVNAEWVRTGLIMSTNGQSYFDLDNNKIKTSNAEITGGTIDIETSGEEVSRIKTKYNQWTNAMMPIGMYVENSETNMSSVLQAGGLWLYEGDKITLNISGSGSIFTDNQIYSKDSIFADNKIQATGSIFTDNQIQAKGSIFTDNRVQAKQLVAGDSVYTDYMLSIYGGNAYIDGSLSAETIIDRTPCYDGNALEELSRVKDDGNGGIDHSTLPKFAQIKISTEKAPMERDLVNKKNKSSITMNETKEDNIEQEHVEGRDIGAMVSVLTKGIQELISRNEKQDRIIEEQGNQIKQLQEKLGVD